MAKSLLNGVNDVLKKVSIIAGDSGELSSLTDSARQVNIDLVVSAWNEAIEELYSRTSTPLPKELAENTITLATDDRDYALQSDLVQLHWPLLNETDGDYLHQYEGGYLKMVADQPQPDNFTGLPLAGAIRPTDGQLYLDRIPTAAENGRVYKYWYDKDLSLSGAADLMPFNDSVYRAMVPVVAEIWRRDKERTFDDGSFAVSLGRAGRLLTRNQAARSWRSYA